MFTCVPFVRLLSVLVVTEEPSAEDLVCMEMSGGGSPGRRRLMPGPRRRTAGTPSRGGARERGEAGTGGVRVKTSDVARKKVKVHHG